ncbi:MAG: UvrD-helicase domain-containing protein [Gemmatimonadaceae bacterium]
MSANSNSPLVDSEARDAVRTNLDTTMLVQAGAGSGKTTLMVDRLVAYVMRGTPIDQIAAVTFTRKAANELRERLENRLEFEARNAERTEEQRAHLQFALRNRERMFIGTIHAFCGRVLREHALDAGLPPDFVELDEHESKAAHANAWRAFLDHAILENNSLLADVIALGIEPMELADAFEQREAYRDVEFPAPLHPLPSHVSVRDELLHLIATGKALQHAQGIVEQRDKIQKTLNRLWRRYRTHNEWQSSAVFAKDAATLLGSSSRDLTQKHWGESKDAKKAAKLFGETVDAFVEASLKPWFEQWWAQVYPHVIALLNAASDAALVERRRRGQLGFDDLLTETARLLRTNAMARNAIGARWRHLLIDEFQDTDPIQAEICFLLASDSQFGSDWTQVVPRPGSLFVVGDPKQSIYRFRRADIATFAMVEARIAKYGQVVSLTNNFRSVPAIGTLVNSHFRDVFHSGNADSKVSNHQAPFAELVTASTKPAHANAGVWHFRIGEQGNAKNDVLVEEDACRIASWIAMRCTRSDRKPSDFLILTKQKKGLEKYARQLAIRNVPVDVTGAASESDSVLEELLIVLRAVSDPSNAIAIIAALEGICFGCSHVDLWNAREAKTEFRITHAPNANGLPVTVALKQMHEWWLKSRTLSAASLVEHILDTTGLLVLAASDELGDRSAGHLLQLVAMLRSGNVGTDLASAITAIDSTLGEDDDASMRAGVTNAVRIMNLHKAKGLEAPVVILAAPIPKSDHDQTVALWRDASGNAHGSLLVQDANKNTLACAIDWHVRAAAEAEREIEEEDRLLYVAVTRAKEELVVSRRAEYMVGRKKDEPRGDESLWAKLARALDEHATPIEVVETDPPGRRVLQVTAEQIATRVAQSEIARAASSVAHYSIVSVTEAAKRSAAQAEEDGASFASELREANAVEPHEENVDADDDPRVFGSLVHLALEGALRGRSEAQLAQYVHAQVWHLLPESEERVLQIMAQRVLATVAQATATNEWKALTASNAVALPELNIAHVTTRDNERVLAEGIVDVVGFSDGSWTVVDWKNSRGSEVGWQRVLSAYQAQAKAYAEALLARTGAPAQAKIVRLTVNSY